MNGMRMNKFPGGRVGCAFLHDGSSGKAAAPRSRFESYFPVTVKTMFEQWQCVEPQYTWTSSIG